jgi:tetratricopeptide (TPR) repeat protein
MAETVDGLAQRAADAMQSGDFVAAADAYEQALAIRPNDQNLLFALGVALQSHSRNPEALAAYLRAMQIDRQFFEAANNAAVLCSIMGEIERAVDIYKEFLLYSRKHLDATVNLGQLLVHLRRPKEAIEYYHDIIIMRPGHPVVAPNMAGIMALIGDGEKAIDHLLRWAKNCPEDADAHFTTGFYLFSYRHDYDAASAHYRAAVDLQPGNPAYRRAYINSLQCAGRYAEAVEQAKLIDDEGFTLVSMRATPFPALP